MKSALGKSLPDKIACLTVMARHNMPEHIIRHCQAVCGVSLYLTRVLDQCGFHLDKDLIRCAALLHDITKIYSFNRPLDHALTGAKLLKRMGYPQVASIVRQHVCLSAARPPGQISEAVIVNYADKRVLHDQITSLQARLDYITKTYVRTPEGAAWVQIFTRQSFQLEKEIFAVLPGGPAQIFNINVEEELEA